MNMFCQFFDNETLLNNLGQKAVKLDDKISIDAFGFLFITITSVYC